jgi:gluconokinase
MIIAVDVGTSSTRAALCDDRGRPVRDRFHQVACAPRVDAAGAAEHDPARLLDAVSACLDAVLPRTAAADIAAVALSTYWHGLCGFDAADRPVTPIYLWADTRSAGDADVLRGALDETAVHARVGCHLHSSYWPAKLAWLARAEPDLVRRVARWGSAGEWLELAFFGSARTSVSMASATGLFDQERADWDPEMLAVAGLTPRLLFPLADRTDARRGLRTPWSTRWPALRSAAWLPAVGDGAASSIGSGCVAPDRIALNVGTSAALRIVSTRAAAPRRGLWRYRLDRRHSVVGGATSEGGNVFAWCRDVLRLPADDAVERALAAAGPTDLVALPFLAGERSPGWRGARRAAITGLTLDTRAVDVLRAMLQAVALRVALVYDLLAPAAAPAHTVVASGAGFDRSRAWAQMIADALGRPIVRSTEPEATSRGTALLALEAVGALSDLAAAAPPPGDTIEPDPAAHARARDAIARQRALDERL